LGNPGAIFSPAKNTSSAPGSASGSPAVPSGTLASATPASAPGGYSSAAPGSVLARLQAKWRQEAENKRQKKNKEAKEKEKKSRAELKRKIEKIEQAHKFAKKKKKNAAKKKAQKQRMKAEAEQKRLKKKTKRARKLAKKNVRTKRTKRLPKKKRLPRTERSKKLSVKKCGFVVRRKYSINVLLYFILMPFFIASIIRLFCFKYRVLLNRYRLLARYLVRFLAPLAAVMVTFLRTSTCCLTALCRLLLRPLGLVPGLLAVAALAARRLVALFSQFLGRFALVPSPAPVSAPIRRMVSARCRIWVVYEAP
jgi:cation transport ATPase